MPNASGLLRRYCEHYTWTDPDSEARVTVIACGQCEICLIAQELDDRQDEINRLARPETERRLIDKLPVDSGTLVVFDPMHAPSMPRDEVHACLRGTGVGVFDQGCGIAVSTDGDGSFPLYVDFAPDERMPAGRPIRIIIELDVDWRGELLTHTPRQRWGTCCPRDPHCHHSQFDDKTLAWHMDHPISDAEAREIEET